eukprot:TRINITY_DN7854_c0_g1_i1.p1 TRINITY_DN7854_c0_g1~~TRINITY_DN7854_c0_g1_i1.p1  ORF type:complete len:466 (+),score=69.94 TRINITY_DN7854_c0_g1_i1:1075-2472(+)
MVGDTKYAIFLMQSGLMPLASAVMVSLLLFNFSTSILFQQDMEEYPVGTLVIAEGLANSKFNGKTGVIKRYKRTMGRVVVSFPPPDNDCALKPENIRPVEETRKRGRSPFSVSEREDENEKKDSSSSSRSSSTVSSSYDRGEEDQEELWLRLVTTEAKLAVFEVYWLFTQFGCVHKIVEKQVKGDCKFILLKGGAHYAVNYLRGREVTTHDKKCRIFVSIVMQPANGLCRDFTQVNTALRNLLLDVSSDEAADGLEEFFRRNKCAPRDFIWNRWVAGQGWLEPKQDDSDKCKIPSRKWEDNCVSIGGLWDSCTAKDVMRLGAMFGKVQGASRPFKGRCVVKYADASGVKLAPMYLDFYNMKGMQKDDLNLRVEEHVSSYTPSRAHTLSPPPVPHPSYPSSVVHIINSTAFPEDSSTGKSQPCGGGVLVKFPTALQAVQFVAKHNGEKHENTHLEMQFASASSVTQ